MSREKTLSRKKKAVLMVGAAALVAGTAVMMTGTSQASVACEGLAAALSDNEQFIAGQRANPDAQSAVRIANREAVIEEIGRKQAASGCNAEAGAGDSASAPATPPADSGDARAEGEVVCAGSTVTLSGEGGAPAASSSDFPLGTRLKITNLGNSKSTTVEVASTSGSCVLLNNAAFEEVREAGKFLIREVRIERVG
ncbi:hypothetical protein ACFVXC_17180 [Streptomyces sp. NPDC058257]|uniref:hypothetical protein n=1 Tax=Streptomyces sp. NPDC058257 TaxID=3346409 RepID=UPI0036EABB2E